MGSRNSSAKRGAGTVQKTVSHTSSERPQAPERVTFYPAPQDENGAVYGLDNLQRINRAQLMLDGLKNLMYLLADARKVPEGKARSSRNAWKGGTRPMLRALAQALRCIDV